MITNFSQYKRMRLIQVTVESSDVSGYSADVMAITIDDQTVATPSNPTLRTFVGEAIVRSSTGTVKPTFLVVYHTTGTYAGKLTVQESTSTFATGDVITVWGALKNP